MSTEMFEPPEEPNEPEFRSSYLFIECRMQLTPGGVWSDWKPCGMAPMPHEAGLGPESLPVSTWIAYAAYLDSRDYRGERYRVVRRSNYTKDEVM